MIITRPLTVKNRWWLQFFSLSLSLSLFFLGERELGGGGRVVGREVDYWAERGSDTDDLLGTMNGLHWIHWWMLFTIFEIKSISGGRYERGRLLSRRSTCSWRCIRQHPSFVFFLSFSPPLFLSRIFCVVFFLHFFLPISSLFFNWIFPVVRDKWTCTIQLSIKRKSSPFFCCFIIWYYVSGEWYSSAGKCGFGFSLICACVLAGVVGLIAWKLATQWNGGEKIGSDSEK